MKVEEIHLALKKNQEVFQLSLIDDIGKLNANISKSMDSADVAWRAYQDYLTRADIPFKKMMQSRTSLVNNIQDAENLSKKFKVEAENLGIKPNSISVYQAIETNMNIANNILKTVDSFNDPSSFQ